MAADQHRWKFYRIGGVDQVVLRDGHDITQLETLDQKLWVALACPVKGLEIDTQTLTLVDSDHDGRIRPPEILQAITWLSKVFKTLDYLIKPGDAVALSAINNDSEVGSALLAGAKRILLNLGKSDADSISIEDVNDTQKIFIETRFNGDGVIPAKSAETPEDQELIEKIMECVGSVPDRSTKPGINKEITSLFFTEAKSFASWMEQKREDSKFLPFGTSTGDAYEAYLALKDKIDDFFARCRLTVFDSRMEPSISNYSIGGLHERNLGFDDADVAKLPIAKPSAESIIDLQNGINPSWRGKVSRFYSLAFEPYFHKSTLSEADWFSLQEVFREYQAWLSQKPNVKVEKLGLAFLQHVTSGGAEERLLKLISQDLELEGENNQIESVKKMLLYRRDFFRLLNNFVNFSDFYGQKGAIFQAGTLYLDGRSCNLCLRVEDAAKHSTLAALAKSYLAYCDLTRPSGEKMQIVAAFTDGDTDQLMVGRNGVFYDRKGQDWDATITKIIENPISVRQAFWAPYKRFVRLVEEQVAKRAAAAESESGGKVTNFAVQAANADQVKKEEPKGPPAPPKKMDVGTVAALGVAIGGIATFFSSVLATFFGLGMWMPVGVIALLLAISGPSMLIAWLKLRQRNLGPILDAGGWAVNGRMLVNVPFGGSLTKVAKLPEHSERSLIDPFAEKKRPIWLYIFLVVLGFAAVLWFAGKLDNFLPTSVRSSSVLKPAASSTPAPSAQPSASASK